MRKRMTETKIVYKLKKAEAGIPAKELCYKYGVTSSTFIIRNVKKQAGNWFSEA